MLKEIALEVERRKQRQAQQRARACALPFDRVLGRRLLPRLPPVRRLRWRRGGCARPRRSPLAVAVRWAVRWVAEVSLSV